MSKIKNFRVFDMITQDHKILQAPSPKDAVKYYFLRSGMPSFEPVLSKEQTDLKSIADSRFVVLNLETKRRSFFNKNGYGYNTITGIEYPVTKI